MDDTLRLLSGTDVYLIDQLLKERVGAGARVIDVGCGGGRNLPWFAAHGHDVTALDPRPEAIDALVQRLAALGLDPSAVRTITSAVEDVDLPAGSADLVICNAVLHFATDTAHFDRMLDSAWRLVAPGGVFFARLASNIGLEDRVRAAGDGRFLLPDGTERYLVDESQLRAATERLGADLLDPIKTTVVERLRSMTTWVLGRPQARS